MNREEFRTRVVYALEWYTTFDKNSSLEEETVDFLVDINSSLDELSPQHRLAINYLYIHDNDIHTIKELSEVLGVSLQYGYRIINNAINELVDVLIAKGYLE